MVAQNILDWFDINKIEEKYKQANKKALEARQEWEEKHPIISGIQKDYQPGYRAAIPKWEQAAKYGMNAPLIEQAKTGLKEFGLNLVPSVNIAVDAATGGSGTLTKQAVKQAIAKPLVPYVGKQIAKNTAEGLIKGAEAAAIGGATQGVTSSLADNGISKDLLSRPILYGGMGLLTGGAFGGLGGFGAGQIGKQLARKNLLGNPEAQMNFARDYLEGLNDKVLTKQGFTLGDIRGLKTGEYGKLGSGRDVLNDILMDDTGNPLSVYHGTANEFEQFDPNMLGSLTGAKSAKQGFWFTEGKNTAKSYANYSAENSGINKLLQQQNLAEKTGNWAEYDRLTEEIEKLALNSDKPIPRIIEANLDVYNPATMDAQGKRFMEIQEDINNFLANNPDADSYIIKNLNDATDNNYSEIVNHYMVKNPESIKMRNIYDIDDNLIKTFNLETEKQQIQLAEENLAKDIEAHLNGKLKPNSMLNFGKPSKILQNFGVPDFDMYMAPKKYDMSTSRKAINGELHYVPDEVMKKIPSLLQKPKMIMKSPNPQFSDSRYVIQINKNDKNGNPIVVILDYNSAKRKINIIPSVYGKENFNKYVLSNWSNVLYKK